MLRGRAEQVPEAARRRAPAGSIVAADDRPHFMEDVGDELPFRIDHLLLYHDVVDVLANRFLLVRGHRVEMTDAEMSIALGLFWR